jgi:hypothetical protein
VLLPGVLNSVQEVAETHREVADLLALHRGAGERERVLMRARVQCRRAAPAVTACGS